MKAIKAWLKEEKCIWTTKISGLSLIVKLSWNILVKIILFSYIWSRVKISEILPISTIFIYISTKCVNKKSL